MDQKQQFYQDYTKFLRNGVEPSESGKWWGWDQATDAGAFDQSTLSEEDQSAVKDFLSKNTSADIANQTGLTDDTRMGPATTYAVPYSAAVLSALGADKAAQYGITGETVANDYTQNMRGILKRDAEGEASFNKGLAFASIIFAGVAAPYVAAGMESAGAGAVGSIGNSAATGAALGAGRAAFTGQNIAKGAAMGAITGGAGAAVSSVIPQGTPGWMAGAIKGAAGGLIGSRGNATEAVKGALSGAATAGATSATGNSMVGGFAGALTSKVLAQVEGGAAGTSTAVTASQPAQSNQTSQWLNLKRDSLLKTMRGG